MEPTLPDAWVKTYARDAENLAVIDEALQSGRINAEAADYIKFMYANGMDWFREVFHFLGKCLGAPKAAVVPYDKVTNSGIDVPMKIVDINPLESYLVQHRLDADPMRNQFFTSHEKCQIDLSVSSIVSVIVGAQKDVHRALDKVTGKYYNEFLDLVLDTTKNKSIIFECFTDKKEESNALKLLNTIVPDNSLEGKLKKVMPHSVKNIIKKVIK